MVRLSGEERADFARGRVLLRVVESAWFLGVWEAWSGYGSETFFSLSSPLIFLSRGGGERRCLPESREAGADDLNALEDVCEVWTVAVA